MKSLHYLSLPTKSSTDSIYIYIYIEYIDVDVHLFIVLVIHHVSIQCCYETSIFS